MILTELTEIRHRFFRQRPDGTHDVLLSRHFNALVSQNAADGIYVAPMEIKQGGARSATQVRTGKSPLGGGIVLTALVKRYFLINVAQLADPAQRVVERIVTHLLPICERPRNGVAICELPGQDSFGHWTQWNLSLYMGLFRNIANIPVTDI